MHSQTITISRKKYAVGLFWQPLVNGMAARGYAASLARSVDRKMNLFAEYRAMVGLGSRRMGHRSGQAVAAAEVADAFSEYPSFIAVFPAAKGFWLVAARNGVVIADRLHENEDDAKGEYARLAVLPDWGILVAPSSWLFPRAVEKHLEDLLPGGARNELRQISHFKGNAITLLLLAAFVFGLLHFFRAPVMKAFAPRPQLARINPDLAAEYKRRLHEKKEEIKQQYMPRQVVQKVDMPYDFLPDKYARAELCWKAIGFLMQQAPGWVQLSAECGAASASANLRRGYGTLADLYAVAPSLFRGARLSELSESDVALRVSLPALETFSSVEELDAESVMRELNSLFQLGAIDGDVRAGMEEIASGAEAVAVNTISVSAKTKLAPREFVKVLDFLSGVSIPKVSWDAKTRIWNYEVIIYVK